MNHYLIKYQPCRSTFLDDATDDENDTIDKHFEYLKKLQTNGILLLADRTDDASMGIALIIAVNEDTARQIMQDDPAVKAGVFSGELHLFRLALMK